MSVSASPVAHAALSLVENQRVVEAVRAAHFSDLPLAAFEAFALETQSALKEGRLFEMACSRVRRKQWGESRWIHVRVIDDVLVVAKYLLLDPYAVIQCHAHAWRTELHLPIAGVTVEASDSNQLKVGAFEMLVVPALCPHGFSTANGVGVVATLDVRSRNVAHDRVCERKTLVRGRAA